MALTPIKITAHLADPILGDAPMLDALLERRCCGRTGNGPSSKDGPVVARGTVPIPIARDAVGELLIPRCSSPLLASAHEGVTFLTRSFPVEYEPLLGERLIFRDGTGPFRSVRLPLKTVVADRVVWFAALAGHTDGLRWLLRTLRRVWSVGNKRAWGSAYVARWTVEASPADYSWFAPGDAGTVLMRPLPADAPGLPADLVGYRRDFDCPCGPYWDKRHAMDVVKPC